MTADTDRMLISLSEEQAMLLDSAREFCRNRSDITSVRALLDSDAGFYREVWQELVSLGWMGVAIGEAHGGSGLGIGSAVPIAECMGRALLSTPFFSATIAAQALVRGGSEQQQDRVLPGIVEGKIATVALLESEDWGDESVALTATVVGDELQLTGAKIHVVDAAVADWFVASVSVEGTPRLLLIDADALAPAAISPQVLIDETRRSARVDFTGARVPVGNLLPGDFDLVISDLRLIAALLHAAEATGSAFACIDTTVEYLTTRKQFGRLIGSYQALKHPTVEVLCAVEDARSFIYHAASVIGEGPLEQEAEIACRMAKAQASEALKFAGDRAIQFHGAMGFTYECDAQLYIRRAQWLQQAFGDAYHHRKRLAPLLLD